MEQFSVGMVEAIFKYLDELESVHSMLAPDTPRTNLGLPNYRFEPKIRSSTFPSCGAKVNFVLPELIPPGGPAYRQQMVAPSTSTGSRPAGTVNNPQACKLCFPNLVRHEFRLANQDVVLVRNPAPYGHNHGVVRSEKHEPQTECFTTKRLKIASRVAQALGTGNGQSQYEVWVAGEGFNTQWHFHVQFRKQRSPVWDYVDRTPNKSGHRLENYPSCPYYFETRDEDQLSSRISAWSASSPGAACGLLLSYEDDTWKALYVISYPSERVFGKQLGLHEHLGEVILESRETFADVESDPVAATKLLEDTLLEWCRPQ